MKRFALVVIVTSIAALFVSMGASAAPGDKLMAKPWTFVGSAADCGNVGAAGTRAVAAAWQTHQGLMDAGNSDQALYLAKMQPTSNCASAGAAIDGVSGMTLTEIGWDVRDDGHCGAGAPRFNIVTNDNVMHFIGCNSPAPIVAMPISLGWHRYMYSPATAFPPIAPGAIVKSIDIVFDEGTDEGQGFVYVDNIDINGILIGQPGNNS